MDLRDGRRRVAPMRAVPQRALGTPVRPSLAGRADDRCAAWAGRIGGCAGPPHFGAETAEPPPQEPGSCSARRFPPRRTNWARSPPPRPGLFASRPRGGARQLGEAHLVFGPAVDLAAGAAPEAALKLRALSEVRRRDVLARRNDGPGDGTGHEKSRHSSSTQAGLNRRAAVNALSASAGLAETSAGTEKL